MKQLSTVIVAALLAVGCGGGSGPDSGSPSGPVTVSTAPMRIWITDAPFPYDYVESASVVVRQVQVRERDSGTFETAFNGEAEFDLVPLTNGVEALLVEVDLPVGTYDAVRMIVQAGEVVLAAEAVVEGDSHVFNTENGGLFFPSGAQTGIKMSIENGITVTTQLTADLVLDFDLSRNFVFNGPVTHAPGVKRVLFTPSVRAVNASTAGSITVDVLSDQLTPDDDTDDLPIEGATVRVLDADENVVVTGNTGMDGTFIASVLPGTYSLEIEASGHAAATVTDIQVVLANLADAGDVVLEASGEIGGTVMSDGGTPEEPADDLVLAGATVELRIAGEEGDPLATATTDANGAWRFAGLEAGAYDIAVNASGFAEGMTEVAAALTTPGYLVLLAALPQSVTGTVSVPEEIDATTVSIVVRNAAGITVATTAPAENGTYEIELATGEYEITFTLGAVDMVESVSLEGADPEPAARIVNVTFE